MILLRGAGPLVRVLAILASVALVAVSCASGEATHALGDASSVELVLFARGPSTASGVSYLAVRVADGEAHVTEAVTSRDGAAFEPVGVSVQGDLLLQQGSQVLLVPGAELDGGAVAVTGAALGPDGQNAAVVIVDPLRTRVWVGVTNVDAIPPNRPWVMDSIDTAGGTLLSEIALSSDERTAPVLAASLATRLFLLVPFAELADDGTPDPATGRTVLLDRGGSPLLEVEGWPVTVTDRKAVFRTVGGGGSWGLFEVDLTGGNERQIPSPSDLTPQTWSIGSDRTPWSGSPDGSRVAIADLDGQVRVIDLETGSSSVWWDGGGSAPSRVTALRWTRDGGWLAVGRSDGVVDLVDRASGDRRGRLEVVPEGYTLEAMG